MPAPSKGTPDRLRWLAAVVPGAIVPFLASLLYFRLLSESTWVQGVYLAAGAFAAHHVVVASTFFGLAAGLLLGGSVAVGGLLWSLMLARQGTLAGAWVSHVLVDLGLAWIGYRLLV
jgi:hypothetical protein